MMEQKWVQNHTSSKRNRGIYELQDKFPASRSASHKYRYFERNRHDTRLCCKKVEEAGHFRYTFLISMYFGTGVSQFLLLKHFEQNIKGAPVV